MITFQNVNKHYGDFHVLKQINLQIEKGEVVVIIGPSGSGKSTLLRCINRLESINEGVLTVNGTAINDRKTDINQVRQNIGMVFQH
ncbi:ATP-binding cassette domain-containing protein, partial [Xanthomonas citri pv. citri]|nr:ATP-binding cassette domain-containing protein [Xanthomonas citri pv. citri]